jgi:predicted ATPase
MNLNASLTQLETAQLVRRADDAERMYQFKHALVQDTAYQSLLKHERKHLHRVVGEALEEAYPAQLDENAALLA